MFGGVLGGLGDYLGVDPTWLRVIYAVAAVISGFGPLILLYIVAMIFVPEEPTATPQQPVWPDTTGTETVQSPPPPPPPIPDPPPPPAPPGTPGS
jgi:phage shock protein C